MTKRNIVIFFAVACIFTVVGVYTSLHRSELQQSQVTAVNALFNSSLPDIAGKQQSLKPWQGKILLVNFWATWCNPCIEEMPELSDLQTTVTNKNIQIIGIGIDSAANITEFLSKHKVSYPVYVADTQGAELARKFGNQAGGLPFTVLIEPDGHIKSSYLGRLKLQELKHDLGLP
jgi:thiol-disulfide isomerase/thioredoxin